MKRKMAVSIIMLLAYYVISPSVCGAEVIVHDGIGKEGKELMLSAETRGIIAAQGGEIVDFYADGKSLGKALSGGDGYAYKAYVPAKTGLIPLLVKDGEHQDEGFLLSVGGKRKIVCVEIDQGFLLSLMTEGKEGIKRAAERIGDRYDLIYISRGFPGIRVIRETLKKQGFPPSPVISWENGTLFSELKDLGGRVEVVIGSQDVIEEGKRNFPRSLGFEGFLEAMDGDAWDDRKGFIKAR